MFHFDFVYFRRFVKLLKLFAPEIACNSPSYYYNERRKEKGNKSMVSSQNADDHDEPFEYQLKPILKC